MGRIWPALACCISLNAFAASTLTGELPRRDDRPLEEIAGLDSRYGVLRAPDGKRLRTILTRPAGTTGRLPAILFVQWLSCDSIELPANQQDGWSRMLRRLAQESGYVMMRTEKPGVGDSEGDCAALDYDTELSVHRVALAALRRSDDVDPERIVVFGASMGGNYASLVAAGEKLAGVMIWGGGAKSWFERMLGFERRAKELGAAPAAELDSHMRSLGRFFPAYLLDGKDPATIVREQPALAGVWEKSWVRVPTRTMAGRSLFTSRPPRKTGRRPGNASTRRCSRSMANTTGSRMPKRIASSPTSPVDAVPGAASLS